MTKKTKLDKLNEIKECFINAIDKSIEQEKITEAVSNIMNKSVSELVSIFESVVDKLAGKKAGKKCIKEYVSTIKENKDLKKVYIASRVIENPVNINESKMFTDTLFRMLQDIDKKNLNEGIEKLRGIVKESVIVSKVSSEEINNMIEESVSDINDSFEYLINNDCTPSNMVEWCNNVSVIAEHIEKNNSIISESAEYKNPSELYEQLSEMVGDGSSNTSKVMLSMSEAILKGEGMETLFEAYRKDCIDAIDSIMEEVSLEEKSRLEGMKISLNEKKYKEDTLSEDLLKMAELKDVIIESVKED